MANNVRDVHTALARAIAERKVDVNAIEAVAKRIAAVKQQIRGIDVCERGICIDFFIDGDDWQKALPGLIDIRGGRFRGIEIFPWGIINPDILHIRVTQEFEEMPGVHG